MRLRVLRHNFTDDPALRGVGQVTKFIAKLKTALGEIAWLHGVIKVRRDIEIIGYGEGAATAPWGTPHGRGEET